MNKQIITIEVSPAGNVNIDAVGFRGKSCTKATEQIELVLGGGSVKRKNKPEYFTPPVASKQSNKMTF